MITKIMRTNYYIQDGLIVKKSNKTEDIYGLFSLSKWLKKMFTRFGVAFNDTCCVNDPLNQPVRYNTTSGHLEYLNTTTDTWVTVPSL